MRTEADIENFLKYMKGKKSSQHTIASYSRSMKKFSKWLNSRGFHSRDVIEEDLQGFKESMLKRGLKTSTVSTHLTAVKSFYTWMHKRTFVAFNPAENLESNISGEVLPKILTEEQIKKLFESLPVNNPTSKRNRAILELAYSTLLRRESIVNLKLSDIDLSNQTVRADVKGEKEVLLPMGKYAKFALEDYLKNERPKLLGNNESEYAWIASRGGKKLAYATIDKIFRLIKERTGLPISMHCLRRSGATHMLLRGASLVFVQRMLSHSNLKAVQHYLKLDVSELHKELKKSGRLK